jgi:hypothetical protein
VKFWARFEKKASKVKKKKVKKDHGRGPFFSEEEAVKLWAEAREDFYAECSCIGCRYESTCDWRYDLYNSNGDCLGAK